MTGAGEPVGHLPHTSTATGTDPARGPVGATDRPGAPSRPRPADTGPDGHDPREKATATIRRERRTVATVFLAPALTILTLLVAWPIARTAWLSLHDPAGGHWVGLHNYITIFTAADIRRALLNNAIWVAVAPTLVTVFGLIFAVLTERVRLATAVRTILIMPMAVSLVSTGIAWRLIYDGSPDRGVVNAAISAVHDVFRPASPYPGARPRDGSVLSGAGDGGYASTHTFAAGTGAPLPLVGVARETVPGTAVQAAAPTTGGDALSGVVWLDFTPGGGGRTGLIDRGEQGLPGIRVQALRDGRVVGSTATDHAGRFTFAGLSGSGYTLALPASNFAAPFGGVSWLGPSLITPAIIVSYLWLWAGFAMLIISAGLAALPRETLEAARVDGASEWQVFRRVTVPLVRPVLVVVMVTLVINVLKIFDLVYVIAPDSSQGAANVVALQMYKVSFGGLDNGLGSALGVLLFVLVVPAMLFNVRRLRRDPS
jgi:alpha-glucoside transport system permease protein